MNYSSYRMSKCGCKGGVRSVNFITYGSKFMNLVKFVQRSFW